MANSTVVVKNTGDTISAAEINNIVTSINTKGDQIVITTDGSATNLTLTYLNTTYPNAKAGNFVLVPAANLKYLKLDSSPTGNWDESPFNLTI